MSELKPCPLPMFGNPEVRMETDDYCGEIFTVIKCMAWLDDGKKMWLELCTDTYQEKDEAIKAAMTAWNTRAERTCEPVKKFSEESPWPRLVCSECGRELHWDDIVNEVGEDSCELQPYCGCGARVVKP